MKTAILLAAVLLSMNANAQNYGIDLNNRELARQQARSERQREAIMNQIQYDTSRMIQSEINASRYNSNNYNNYNSYDYSSQRSANPYGLNY